MRNKQKVVFRCFFSLFLLKMKIVGERAITNENNFIIDQLNKPLVVSFCSRQKLESTKKMPTKESIITV